MTSDSTFNPEQIFPLSFFGQAMQAIQSYRRFFPSYLILSMVTFLPFIILDELTSFDTLGISGFITARFFDVVVFISIPFLITNNQVSVTQVLQIFFQKFFARVVLICLLQFAFIALTITFFGSLHIALLFLGFFAYLFVLFAGIFLVFYSVGQEKLTPIPVLMVNSFLTVRSNFSLIFKNMIQVSIFAAIPTLVFLLFYTSGIQGLEDTKNLQNLIQTMMDDSGLRWGMVIIQVLIRPFESLFLAFLFLSILGRRDKERTQTFFFGTKKDNQLNEESPQKPSEDESR